MMDRPSFSHLAEEEQDWIDAYLDGTIESQAFEALQDRMLESPELRAIMRRYLALDNSLQNESETDRDGEVTPWVDVARSSAGVLPERSGSGGDGKPIRFPNLVHTGIAAALAFFLGLGIMHWRAKSEQAATAEVAELEPAESFAEGFAVVSRLLDAKFRDAQAERWEGDTVGAEVFRLEAGVAEIQFFSGATMTVEGPAEIALKSAWEASCHEGAVRMRVPPAARGFKLHAPSTEIVDLGTEFGLVVRDGEGHVEVFDGEIALRHQGEEEQILEKGSALDLTRDGPSVAAESGAVSYPDAEKLGSNAAARRQDDFLRWQAHRDSLAQDERLIAYYTFDRDRSQKLIPNMTVPRNPEYDGAVILAEEVDGRWPGLKSALEFRRPGSRVRVNLPGEFPALTFAAWVRIDSLDRRYNALFMGDGYETGEPHWQIRDDGKLMLSVMVDDKARHPKFPTKSRFHHVYYSPPMWDLSMSGQWLHLASVYDPQNRVVSHYVNGSRISREDIEPDFVVDTLRIGNGEIGNWGQPFREDPTFAIRNLNGRMDEVAIIGAAFDDGEIAAIYRRSRSTRR